jgi:hypothetical protein
MKLIVRAWREETDGRKARSLRSAKDWGASTHAPGRAPTDCLPTAYVRLVEGGRLKALREANTAGVRNRLVARGWRCTKMANMQVVGWPGQLTAAPEVDPMLVHADARVDHRNVRRLAREQRQTADTARRDEAGSSEAHGAEAGASGASIPSGEGSSSGAPPGQGSRSIKEGHCNKTP